MSVGVRAGRPSVQLARGPLDPQNSTDVLLEPYRRVMPKHEVSATLNMVNYSLFYLHNRHQRKRIAS